MVSDINYLLKNNANDFYWTFIERNAGSSWSQLKTALTKRFQDRRTDDEIRWILEARKQKPRESFNEFYSDILRIALQCENPLSDQQLMNIMRHNMRAGLQDKLVDKIFSSIDEMVRQCVAYEDTWARTAFVPEMLCTNRRLVYEMSHSNLDNEVEDHGYERELFEIQQRRYSSQVTPNYTQRANVSSNDQRGFDRLHCFGCGAPGIIKANCARCQNQMGNDWRGQRTGHALSPRIQLATRSNQNQPNRNNSVDAASNTDPELNRQPNWH